MIRKVKMRKRIGIISVAAFALLVAWNLVNAEDGSNAV